MMAKDLEKFTHSLQPRHPAVHDLDSEVNLSISEHTSNPSINQKGARFKLCFINKATKYHDAPESQKVVHKVFCVKVIDGPRSFKDHMRAHVGVRASDYGGGFLLRLYLHERMSEEGKTVGSNRQGFGHFRLVQVVGVKA